MDFILAALKFTVAQGRFPNSKRNYVHKNVQKRGRGSRRFKTKICCDFYSAITKLCTRDCLKQYFMFVENVIWKFVGGAG